MVGNGVYMKRTFHKADVRELDSIAESYRKLYDEHGTSYFKHKRKGTLYVLLTETNVVTENESFVNTYVFKECEMEMVGGKLQLTNQGRLFSRPKQEFLEKFEPYYG